MLHITTSSRIDKLAQFMSECMEKCYKLSVHSDYYIPEDKKILVLANPASAEYLKYQIAQQNDICMNLNCHSNLIAEFERIVKESSANDPNEQIRLLNLQCACSALYRRFYNELSKSKTDDLSEEYIRELALSRAQVLASHIIQYQYNHVVCNTSYPPKYTNNIYTNEYKEYIDYINDAYKNDNFSGKSEKTIPGCVIKTPEHWLNDDRFKSIAEAFPEFIFIFDPMPMSAFEIALIQKLKDNNKKIFIAAYTPTSGYWINEKQTKRDGVPSGYWITENSDKVLNNFNKSAADGKDKATGNGDEKTVPQDENIFNSPRKRYIAKEVFKSLYRLDPKDPGPDFEIFDMDEKTGCPTNLQAIQSCVTDFEDALPPIQSGDDSIHIDFSFHTVNDEVRACADDIIQIYTNKDDEKFLFDDITILVPANKAETYAAAIQSEFSNRNLPYNLKNLLSHPLTQCYSAFEAFVGFLASDAGRADVLNWAFHPAVIEEELAAERNTFTHQADKFGILAGINFKDDHFSADETVLNTDDIFTWEAGVQRIIHRVMYAGSCYNQLDDVKHTIIEPGEIDDTSAVSFLTHYHRIHSMLSDFMTVRNPELKLTYTEWRKFIFKLFECRIRKNAEFYEQSMSSLHALIYRRWLEDMPSDGNRRYTFDAVLPLLRSIVRHLRRAEANQLFGGIQVRAISENVFTSKYLYILGQTIYNFPSPRNACLDYEQYSKQSLDDYAWMKWFLNVTRRLYISAAALNEAQQLSLFTRQLALINETAVNSDGDSEDITASPREQFGQQLRNLRSAFIRQKKKDGSEPQAPFPTSLYSFESKDREILRKLLNDRFSRENEYDDDPDITNTAVNDSKPGDHDGENRKYRELKWKALADLLNNPVSGYRKHGLGINNYILEKLPSTAARKNSTPIEPDGLDYTAKTAIDSIIMCCFAANRLGEFEKLLDTGIAILQKEGKFPVGTYAEIFKNNAINEVNEIRNKLAGSSIVNSCIITLKSHEDCPKKSHALFDRWREAVFFNDTVDISEYDFHHSRPSHKIQRISAEIKLTDSCGTPVCLTGDLPIIARIRFSDKDYEENYPISTNSVDKNTCNIFTSILEILNNDRSNSEDSIIEISHVCIKSRNQITNRKTKIIEIKNIPDKKTKLYTEKKSNDMDLTSLINLFDSGYHEISDGWGTKLSPLCRYAGDETAFDHASQELWKQYKDEVNAQNTLELEKMSIEENTEKNRKEAEKDKKAAEKEAEKIKKAAEKEAEKARKAAEKEAEKARKAAEKEAEKARKAAEKEAEKARKAAEKLKKSK